MSRKNGRPPRTCPWCQAVFTPKPGNNAHKQKCCTPAHGNLWRIYKTHGWTAGGILALIEEES